MTPDEARAALNDRPTRSRATQTEQERAQRANIANKAVSYAKTALTKIHADEYRVLYETARADLLAEAGLE